MAKLKAYTRNALASSMTGVPAPDRSGEILSNTAMQMSNQFTDMVIGFAKEESIIKNKLDVMNAQTDYNIDVNKAMLDVQNEYGDDTALAAKKFEEVVTDIKSSYEGEFSEGRRSLMFKMATASVDIKAVSDMSKWSVKRNKQIVDEKVNSAFVKESGLMSSDVIEGEGFDALDKRLLGVDLTLDALDRGRTDPTYDKSKDKHERKKYFVQSYVNQQMQSNPQLLYSELVKGDFTQWTDAYGTRMSLLDSDEVESLKSSAMNAIKNKMTQQTLATTYQNLQAISNIIGKDEEGTPIFSGNMGSLDEIENTKQSLEKQRLDLEKQKISAQDLGMPEEVTTMLDMQIELIDLASENVDLSKKQLTESGMIQDKKQHNPVWEVQFIDSVNDLLETAGDEPDESFAPALMNAYGTLLKNRHRMPVSSFKSLAGKILPARTKALADYYEGLNEGHKGMIVATSTIKNMSGYYVSADKNNVNRAVVMLEAQDEFWKSYSVAVQQAGGISKEAYASMAMDSFVKGLINTDTLSKKLQARLEADGYVEGVDKVSGISTTIWKDKTTGHYRIQTFKGKMQDKTKEAIKQSSFVPAGLGFNKDATEVDVSGTKKKEGWQYNPVF